VLGWIDNGADRNHGQATRHSNVGNNMGLHIHGNGARFNVQCTLGVRLRDRHSSASDYSVNCIWHSCQNVFRPKSVGSESSFSMKDLRTNNPGTGSQIWCKPARNAEAYETPTIPNDVHAGKQRCKHRTVAAADNANAWLPDKPGLKLHPYNNGRPNHFRAAEIWLLEPTEGNEHQEQRCRNWQ
jgi:hypothetical protein